MGQSTVTFFVVVVVVVVVLFFVFLFLVTFPNKLCNCEFKYCLINRVITFKRFVNENQQHKSVSLFSSMVLFQNVFQ